MKLRSCVPMLIALACLLVPQRLFAQNSSVNSTTIGSTVKRIVPNSLDVYQADDCTLCLLKTSYALGATIVPEGMPEGSYSPVLMLARLHYTFGPQRELSGLSFYAEPQFNPVSVNNSVQDLEFGVNAGLQYSLRVHQSLSLYAAIGTGPHYVTVTTKMQAGGFIFSDNFIVGAALNIPGLTGFDLQYRFRHISNASLKAPNNGIDNHFLVLAFTP